MSAARGGRGGAAPALWRGQVHTDRLRVPRARALLRRGGAEAARVRSKRTRTPPPRAPRRRRPAHPLSPTRHARRGRALGALGAIALEPLSNQWSSSTRSLPRSTARSRSASAPAARPALSCAREVGRGWLALRSALGAIALAFRSVSDPSQQQSRQRLGEQRAGGQRAGGQGARAGGRRGSSGRFRCRCRPTAAPAPRVSAAPRRSRPSSCTRYLSEGEKAPLEALLTPSKPSSHAPSPPHTLETLLTRSKPSSHPRNPPHTLQALLTPSKPSSHAPSPPHTRRFFEGYRRAE